MQDFANHKEGVQSQADIKPWSLDAPSLLIGVLIGIFIVFIGLIVADFKANQIVVIETPLIEEEVEKPFVFEFYEILKSR